MITKPNLIKLVKFKRLHAKALLVKKRYAASIYIAGYAIELALKYQICKILRFNNGFPEDRNEFNNYRNALQAAPWRNAITDVGKIKNHNLATLLVYSGEQLTVQNNFLAEWNFVVSWSETLRYLVSIVRAKTASNFLDAAETIVAQLM